MIEFKYRTQQKYNTIVVHALSEDGKAETKETLWTDMNMVVETTKYTQQVTSMEDNIYDRVIGYKIQIFVSIMT